MNRTARKIAMIVAAFVFAFSSAMVLKNYGKQKALVIRQVRSAAC